MGGLRHAVQALLVNQGTGTKVIGLAFVWLERPSCGTGVAAIDEELHRTDPQPRVAVTSLASKPRQRLSSALGRPPDTDLHRCAGKLSAMFCVHLLPSREPTSSDTSLDNAGDTKTEKITKILDKTSS